MTIAHHRRRRRDRLALAAVLALLPALAACPDEPARCRRPFAGDPAQPIFAEPFVLDVSADETEVVRREVKDGDAVPLVIPQQGGFVLYAGLRLANLDPCQVTVSGELLDESGGTAVSNRDTREADLEPTAGPGGLYLPEDLAALSTVPNVPVCPNFLGKAVAEVPAVLALTVRDRGGRTARVTRKVTPSCQRMDTRGFCLCTCGADYQPGKCALDGGVALTDGAAGD